MRLVKEDIVNIDAWLKKKGIKYIDVRYELVDHLVTEYENIENYPDLGSFLQERKVWCKAVAKKKQKAIHFGIQKALWKRLLKLFSSVHSLLLIILISLCYYGISVSVSEVIFKRLLFFTLLLPVLFQLYLMFYSGLGKAMKKGALSAVYLLNIFGLPQLFVQFSGVIPAFISENTAYMALYVFFGSLVNVAAILTFLEKRKELLKEFELLKEAYA